jgi:hypothetical protein
MLLLFSTFNDFYIAIFISVVCSYKDQTAACSLRVVGASSLRDLRTLLDAPLLSLTITMLWLTNSFEL